MVDNTSMSLPKGALARALGTFADNGCDYALAIDSYVRLLLAIHDASSGETREKLEEIIWEDDPVSTPTFCADTELFATFSQMPNFNARWIREFKQHDGYIVVPPTKGSRHDVVLSASSTFHAKWCNDMDAILLDGRPFLTCETAVRTSRTKYGTAYHLMMEDDVILSIVNAKDYRWGGWLLESLQDAEESRERVFLPTFMVKQSLNLESVGTLLFPFETGLDFGLPSGRLIAAEVNTKVVVSKTGVNEGQLPEYPAARMWRSGLVFDRPFVALWSHKGIPTVIARIQLPPPRIPKKRSNDESWGYPFPCGGGYDWTGHRCKDFRGSERTLTR